MSEQPFTFGEAKERINTAKAQQQAAETAVREAYSKFGLARRAYQTALAGKILELRVGGTAATLCADIARGDPQVAALRFNRDVAEGVMEAARSAVWRHTADRRELEQLVDWSKRREFAEAGGEPQWSGSPA